jgi:hypothetical protein
VAVTWLLLVVAVVAVVDAVVLWAAGRWPRCTRWHGIDARGLRVRWRVGLVPGEWWVGARRDFAMDAWMVCLLPGVVVVVGAESRAVLVRTGA